MAIVNRKCYFQATLPDSASIFSQGKNLFMWSQRIKRVLSFCFSFINILQSPSFQTVFFLIIWKCILFQNFNSQRMWYIRSLFSEIREREGCLTANLPIDNRIVNILLEAVTRKAFFRRVSTLARLCLAAIENFLVLERCNKL